MIKKSNTRLLVAAVSMIVAGSFVTTDAMAHKRHKRHHHKRHHATRSHSTGSYSSYSSAGSEVNSKVDALEAQVRAMQDEMSALKAAGAGAGSADATKVQELDSWMQETKASGGTKSKDNMVFFRGGYARNDQQPIATTSNLSCTNGVVGPVGCTSSDKEGWYFGAGFDFSLSEDLFGLTQSTELLAELQFDYNELGTFTGNVSGALGIPNSGSITTQSQLRLTAAPKIKFFKGSKLRPWIIPAGFTLNVMSPPSQLNTISHLMPAIHFGGGVDYNIWKNLYVGADVRYNWALNKLDGTNTNGLTAGGYLGIGF